MESALQERLGRPVGSDHEQPEANRIVVRAGVPQPYGHLVKSAHAHGIPVLFSANAFARSTRADGCFNGFNLAAARNMPEGLDAALDSAGFVAANKYGRYRWTVSEYYDLVTSRNWAWHAAMDYCMEPQVAGSKLVRMIRLNATVQGYLSCANEAQWRGAPMPMPVLQGWMPEDYLRCTDLLTVQDWPDLVGIGSVCRRALGGPDGIVNIVEALDRALPAHVKFHLFGVKGGAVREFGGHPRFASIDSMAWDFALRCSQRTGRTQAMRADAMTTWQAKQATTRPLPWGAQPQTLNLFAEEPDLPTTASIVHQTVADWYADHLADHGYVELNHQVQRQAMEVLWQIEVGGIESLAESSDMVEMAVYAALLEAEDLQEFARERERC